LIRAAIIGCGKIADQHAEIIHGMDGAEIVGVCDREELMARQMYERFDVKKYFTDAKEMLEASRPDVVHITTPPESHFDLGRMCLEAGANVYIEKPFTLDASEAERLIRLAEEKGLKLTVGHNAQFTHVARRMRQLIRDGYLGGAPVHMESIYNYDLSDPSYARALLGDKNHWVRKLPGKLLQNIINHGVSKIAEHLTGDDPKIIAHGFTSKVLRGINETEIVDELRVIIHDGSGDTTAYFTFSSQMSPILHQFRVYGPKNSLVADDDDQTLIKLRGKRYKSYLNQFLPPMVFARQYLSGAKHNIWKFIKRDFHVNTGMIYLVNEFYRSISEDAPPPIPYREILLTTKIMDRVFEQIGPERIQDVS
jgi:predicted dehydrogenase